MTALAGWENFYVIVGSAAGALIGLQFVVVTLVAESPAQRVAEGVAAFATPAIVHFGVVLLLSAVVSAPWHKIGTVSVVWGLVGLGGMVYAVIVSRRLRAQTIYQPVLEDWLFHVLLPFAAYAVLAGSAYLAHSHAPSSVRPWRCDAAPPLCWHSQCLGRRHVPRIYQEA
jgi:hypothetical protein